MPVTSIILVGFMGAGKSSVGCALARQLGWQFEDLDTRVEQRERKSVAELFRDSGEAEFRRAEHGAMQELLAEISAGSNRVIALGGGAFVQEATANLIEASKVPTVFLDADPGELWERCTLQARERGTRRPLLADALGFRKLYAERRPNYLKASMRQETSGKTVPAIAAELIQALGLGQ